MHPVEETGYSSEDMDAPQTSQRQSARRGSQGSGGAHPGQRSSVASSSKDSNAQYSRFHQVGCPVHEHC